MGQKVHPIGFRLGIIKESQARWYAERRGFTQYLHEDIRVRRTIMGTLAEAGVAKVEIERSANQMTVTIHAAKPGIVIGKSGVKVEELRKNLETTTGKKVRVTIQEIRQPELDACLVSRSVAEQLEKRVAFRRAMKQAVGRAMRFGARGVRVQVSGRLGGAEMSRRESDRDGRVPLHTLRADIDFAITEAHTTYGAIGVKVWIYRGDILPASREPAAGSLAGRSAAARASSRAPLAGDAAELALEPDAAAATTNGSPPLDAVEIVPPPAHAEAGPSQAGFLPPVEAAAPEAIEDGGKSPAPARKRRSAAASAKENTEPAAAAVKKPRAPRASAKAEAEPAEAPARKTRNTSAAVDAEPAKKPRAGSIKTVTAKESPTTAKKPAAKRSTAAAEPSSRKTRTASSAKAGKKK